MLVSYNWIKDHFGDPLPQPKDLAELLTMHSFEVESVQEHADDFLFNLDVLPNRASDCLSHFGVAREVGMLLERIVSYPKEFEAKPQKDHSSKLSVRVEDSQLCPRYIAREVSDILVTDSPEWIRRKLEAMGQRSINSVVDVANVVMFETGQPLHAFDADKLSGKTISVRYSKKGEKITTLDDRELSLDPNTLVIADEKGPIALAGVKGGKRCEVDKETKNIILESANFNQGTVRKTSLHYALRTDASKRFENSLAPETAETALEIFSSTLARLQEGTEKGPKKKINFGKPIDVYPNKRIIPRIAVTPEKISAILGDSISTEAFLKILKRLNFSWKETIPMEDVIREAPKYEGAQYAYGTLRALDATTKAFDSALFMQFLFASAGVWIPRLAVDQYVFGREVKKEDMEPGCVVFSNTGEEYPYFESVDWMTGTVVPLGIDHAGLYLGEGKIIHASRSSGKVVIHDLKESPQFKNLVGIRKMVFHEKKQYVVTPPNYRLDIQNPEDIAEEVGRIRGYELIPQTPLLDETFSPIIQEDFYVTNLLRNILCEIGFSEVYTRSFAPSGSREVRNPLATDKPYLRSNLSDSMQRCLDQNEKVAPLLGNDCIRLFEIGKVFTAKDEEMSIAIGIRDLRPKKESRVSSIFSEIHTKFVEVFGDIVLPEPSSGVWVISVEQLRKKINIPTSYGDVLFSKPERVDYKAISIYPFLLRDLAVFIPESTDPSEILKIVNEEGRELLKNVTLFDVFAKTDETGDKKISYAYHIVFQATDRTLSDNEANEIMSRITLRLNKTPGCLVR